MIYINPPLSFDGCGINGPDEYRTRIATFRDRNTEARIYGPLFEASPAMLEALQWIIAEIDEREYRFKGTDPRLVEWSDKARAIVKQAEGQPINNPSESTP